MTNGERIRACKTEEHMVSIYYNLLNLALYSGGECNRLLSIHENPMDLFLWLNKESDSIDDDIFKEIPLEEVERIHTRI